MTAEEHLLRSYRGDLKKQPTNQTKTKPQKIKEEDYNAKYMIWITEYELTHAIKCLFYVLFMKNMPLKICHKLKNCR